MSKYLAFTEVVFKDLELVAEALHELGCGELRRGTDLVMGRYWPEQTERTADLIIPRHALGNYYGDIGLVRAADGTYSVVLDELDRTRTLNGQFLAKLRTAYHEKVVANIAARVRGTMHRSSNGHVLTIKIRY